MNEAVVSGLGGCGWVVCPEGSGRGGGIAAEQRGAGWQPEAPRLCRPMAEPSQVKGGEWSAVNDVVLNVVWW